MNYCVRFIRQQENQQLGIPPALAGQMPNELRAMLGYDLHRGLCLASKGVKLYPRLCIGA